MKLGVIRSAACLCALLLALFLAPGVGAEGPASSKASSEGESRSEPALRELRWSTTIFGQYKGIHSPQDDDGIGGFFDQYEYTPNKGSGFPVELGIRDASFDWIEDGEALIQFRFESPTSNLGLSGSDIDDAFFNQRALLLGRKGAFQFDFDYRRLRTEQRRVFPETQAGGAGLPFTDLSGSNDRFYRERTGFEAELRWRPDESFAGGSDRSQLLAWLAPELALRGGYDARDSRRQLRTILNPGNDWLSLSQTSGDEVADVGAGLLVTPGGLFTITFDFDHQDFSSDNAQLDDSLPFASTSRSVGFIPSSHRNTGQILVHARIADRAVVTAGFQASVLDQEDPETPAQRSAGLGRNKTIVYSAQLSGDVQIVRDVSANAFVKFIYRDHDIKQSTLLFNPTNGTQVDEFLDSYSRVDMGAEALYRPHRSTKLALGVRLLWIDRDLDYAPTGLGNLVILPENGLVNDETMMWTLFGRADLRPLRGLGIRAELSYREAPDTGYVTDLDGYVEGSLRATYALASSRPTTLSFYVRGGTGENSDFSMVEGLGPNPPGRSVKRDYERSHWNLGLSSDMALREDLSVFTSFFYARDQQSDDLLLSNVQRYFQESVPITFRSPGGLDYQSDEWGVVLGSQFWFSERTDAGLSYSFTHAEADYTESGSAAALQLIDDNRVVDANIHALDFEIRHKLREGIKLFAGYRLQSYSDGAPKPDSLGSATRPPDRSDIRHTLSFGITLNSDLLSANR